MAEDERTGLRASLATLYRLMSPARRRQFHIVAMLMPLAGLAEMVTLGAVVPFIAVLVDRSAIEGIPWLADALNRFGASNRTELILAAGALLCLAALLSAVLRLQLARSSQRFAFSFGHELAVEIQQRVLLQPYSFHIERNSSQIIASLGKVELMVFSLLLPLLQATAAGVVSLAILIALAQVDLGSVMLSALIIVGIYALTLFLFRRRLVAYSEVIGSAHEQRVQVIQESLGGIRDIILDESQEVFVERFRDIDASYAHARSQVSFLAVAPRFLIEAFALITVIGLTLLISVRHGSFTTALPILGAMALGAQRLLPLFQQFYQSCTTLAGSRATVAQVMELLELPTRQQNGPPGTPRKIPFERSIRFDNVGFEYSGRLRPTLEAIDFSLAKGVRVALVGKTGSGKSTMIDLLMGLLHPTRGAICIDGIPLTPETRRHWQSQIAHVPQAIFLADTTIARNIAFGARAPDMDIDGIKRAAKAAQLSDFIETLPDGYDTIVGERGVRLSGGQRQRLGLARAIYKQAPVLVLDEATSALDDMTEAAVLGALDELSTEGKTIIIVAHRQSTVATCELVIRLENGRIADVGAYRVPGTATAERGSAVG